MLYTIQMKRRYPEFESSNDYHYIPKRRKLNDNNQQIQKILMSQQKILDEMTKKIERLESNINNQLNGLNDRITKLETQFNPPKFTSSPSYFY